MLAHDILSMFTYLNLLELVEFKMKKVISNEPTNLLVRGWPKTCLCDPSIMECTVRVLSRVLDKRISCIGLLC